MTSAEGKSKRSGNWESRTCQSESRTGSTNALQVLAAEKRSFLVWAIVCETGWGSNAKITSVGYSHSWMPLGSVQRVFAALEIQWPQNIRPSIILITPEIGPNAWAIVSFLFPSSSTSNGIWSLNLSYKPTSGRTLLIVGFKDDERRMVRTISKFEILCIDEV